MKHRVGNEARIEAIDLLRGVALLGILLVNIENFAMPSIAQFNPTAYGDQGRSNELIHALTYVLAEQKFMAIFSMLFGAGVLLLSCKHEDKGQRPGRFHYARVFWLLVFGLAHMFLIWGGDVLVVYAGCACVLYAFRRLRPQWQFLLGLIIFLTPVGLNTYVDAILPTLEPARHARLQSVWQPNENRLADELEVFRGSYLGQVTRRLGLTKRPIENDSLGERIHSDFNLPALFASWLTPIVGSVARALGMMFVGMALFTWGALSGTRSSRLYRRTAVVGLGVGIPLSAYGYYQNVLHSWRYEHVMFAGRNVHIVATVFISLAYVACIMLWAQSNWCANIRHRLVTVGRMSLTNYILQSLLATTVFYGFGFGYFGFLSRLQQFAVVCCIWAIQIGCSSWWLNRYRYGPLEWLWRSLTYWQVMPLRR